MFKAFLVIFSYVTSYEFKNLVEVASIELKTQPINLKALLLNKKTH